MDKNDYRSKAMKDLKKSVEEIQALLAPEINKAMESTSNKHKLEALNILSNLSAMFDEMGSDTYRMPTHMLEKLNVFCGYIDTDTAKIEKSFNKAFYKACDEKDKIIDQTLKTLDKAVKKSGLKNTVLHRDENSTGKESALLDGKTVGEAIDKLEDLLLNAAGLTNPDTIEITPKKGVEFELTEMTQEAINAVRQAAEQDSTNKAKYEAWESLLREADKYDKAKDLFHELFVAEGSLGTLLTDVKLSKVEDKAATALEKFTAPEGRISKKLEKLGYEKWCEERFKQEQAKAQKEALKQEAPQQEEIIETAQPRQGLDMVEIERVAQTLEQIVLREDLAVNKEEIKNLAILSVEYRKVENINSGISFDKFCENNGLIMTPAMTELYTNLLNGNIAAINNQMTAEENVLDR